VAQKQRKGRLSFFIDFDIYRERGRETEREKVMENSTLDNFWGKTIISPSEI